MAKHVTNSSAKKSKPPVIPRRLAETIAWLPITTLKPFPNNPRKHPNSQIAALQRSLAEGWTNPIAIDEKNIILAGHGRLEAAKRLGITEVPTIRISGLSPEEKLSLVIRDNKIAEQSIWDFDFLKVHFQGLLSLEFDVERTGFTTGEVDILMDDPPSKPSIDPDDDVQSIPQEPPVSQGPRHISIISAWEKRAAIVLMFWTTPVLMHLARIEMKFSTLKGGFRYTTTVGGTLTGRGADVLIVDDPMKAQDRGSERERDRVPALVADLNARDVRTRLRQSAKGTTGGVRYTTGPLSYLLKNKIYVGEIGHKGQSYTGEHQAILDRALFDAVQERIAENAQAERRAPEASGAILTGKILDDRGNVMTPTYSVKGGLRYRYYVSRACVEGRKSEKGTVHRVPAYEVESKITESLRTIELANDSDAPDHILMARVSQVRIERGYITVALTACETDAPSSPLRIPWTPKPTKAKRDIILPHTDSSKDQRPIQVEQRARLLRAVAKGRLWMRELVAGDVADAEMIAAREKRSKRSVQMMLSLAFVAPDIIEAAVKGALPRGIGLTRLMDLPPLWSEQRKQLGLKA